jgi:DNA-directed RNA polymerase specialized sigma24 family protein
MNVATNSAINYIRRGQRERAVERPPQEATKEPEVLQKAISELDPSLSAVFVLQELEQLSVGEVGKALGLTESEVGSRLRRAHMELRGRLSRLQYELTKETIEEIRRTEEVVLPKEFEKRLHEQVQRWLM